MANGNKETSAALSFYQLLGAPLYALIEAETYAADATAQFIERVGFKPRQGSSGQPGTEFGDLRTISFRQERRDADGRAASYEVAVPLLSILPIPAMQIREAELDFYVKIVDMVLEESHRTSPSIEGEAAEEQVWDRLDLISDNRRIDFKTMMGRGQTVDEKPAGKSAFDMQVHVKIKVEQADIPAGLSRLFNLMEESITSTRLSEDNETP